MPIDPYMLPWLFLAATAAGLVDSIAGGGGLITVPVLLATGLDPKLAFGTNKLQACFGSGTATISYAQHGLVEPRRMWLGVLFTAIGAVVGTVAVLALDSALLERLVPFLLLGILAYMVVRPKVGDLDARPRMGALPFYATFGLAIGFYDGFFGPGTGSFWLMAFMLGLGLNMPRATGHTKVMNFTSNIVSLATFVLAGQVVVVAGLAMGVGQMIGARIGAHLVSRRGARLIRPVFLVVVLLTTLMLAYDAWFKR